MPQLAALGIKNPEINALGSFTRGAANMLQLQEAKRAQAEKGLQVIGSIALGAMGGDLNGPVDPQKYEQGLDMLASQGIDVSKWRGKPQMAPVAARASMSALQQLQLAQNERQLDLAMKKFGLQMDQYARELAQGPEASSSVGKIAQDYKLGLITKEEYEAGVAKATEPSGGINVNVGPQGVDYGDPPSGYAWARNPDNTVKLDERGAPIALPIGPKLEEQRAQETSQQKSSETAERTANIVIEDIGRLKKLVEEAPWYNPATGFGAETFSQYGGTNAANAAELALTIKGNIGFDRLQRMREESPTGGALGQVTENELKTLQAVLGSLAQSQSEEQLLYNLDRLNRVYTEILRKAAAYPNAAKYGFDQQIQEQPGSAVTVETAPEASGDMPTVTTREEYDALPSGAVFMSNGKKWRKP